MKLKTLNIFSLMLMGVLVMLSSCEKEDDYNFDAIEPIIFSMDGPPLLAAHGLPEFPEKYSVAHRGGSSFDWTLGGHGGTYVVDDDFESIIYVTWNQSDADTEGTITVTETTAGGVTSDPFTYTVTLTAFCPEVMDTWGGDWVSHNFLGETDYGYEDVEVEVVGTALNTLKLNAFFDWVTVGFWEENWIPGEGNEGNAIIEFDCGNTVKIDSQLLGVTYEWGPYWLWGEGTFDPDTKTIVLNYSIGWAEGDEWNSFTATLTREIPGDKGMFSTASPKK